MGDSFLDTGGLPFGGTHSWVQGDSPLRDSFLDTGGLPFGGLFSWIQGDSPPLGNSFLWGGSHICLPTRGLLPAHALRRHSSSSYPLMNSFLPLGRSLPNLLRTHSCPLQLTSSHPEVPYSWTLGTEISSLLLTQSRRTGSSLFELKEDMILSYLPCLREDRDPYSLQRDRSGNRIWFWERDKKKDRTLV